MAEISKRSAQNAKDRARKEKQEIMRDAGKRFTAQQSKRLKELNGVIKAADQVINRKNNRSNDDVIDTGMFD